MFPNEGRGCNGRYVKIIEQLPMCQIYDFMMTDLNYDSNDTFHVCPIKLP